MFDKYVEIFGYYNPYCISHRAPYGFGYGTIYARFFCMVQPYNGLWGGQVANNPKSTSRNWTELQDDATALILSHLNWSNRDLRDCSEGLQDMAQNMQGPSYVVHNRHAQ